MNKKNQQQDTLEAHPLVNELRMAITFAEEAGKLVQTIRAKGYKVYDKGHFQGQVTDADHAASELLIKQLSLAFPDDLIISEEAPLPQGPHKNRIWFIDPIDGTKEFIAGSDEWSIMIGLAIKGKPKVGVVYQPDGKQLYYALKDGGAFFSIGDRTERIKIRTVSEPKDAILIQSRSHLSLETGYIAKKLGVNKSLKQGSVGLKLGMIAAAKADFYFNFSHHCHLWDLCAPEAILQEAGGLVVLASGKNLLYNLGETLINESFLATNKELLAKLYPFLK